MKEFSRKLRSAFSVKGTWIEIPVAAILISIFLPIHILNVTLAVIQKRPVIIPTRKLDALGRMVVIKQFSSGLAKRTAVLYDVFIRKISFVGVSMAHSFNNEQRQLIKEQYETLPGLVSLYDIHMSVGIETSSPWELLKQQLNGSTLSHVVLLIKASIGFGVYYARDLKSPKVASLFDLPINNVLMREAVDWSVYGSSLIKTNNIHVGPQLGFFVNAHSVNLAESDPLFKSCLRHAHVLFADGSGMRVAAKSVGIKLKSNINGTDMLPKICKRAELENKSIYFLGGQPGIAQQAAEKLKAAYPNLEVAGTEHGYFQFDDKEKNAEIVSRINASKADIVLVGLGSPNQEHWCLQNFKELQCTSVLAVGGLFDYYSGAIPRAPIAFRELGLEWIWRLMQEPVVKFKRYVIGTPEFLVRTFLFKQV